MIDSAEGEGGSVVDMARRGSGAWALPARRLCALLASLAILVAAAYLMDAYRAGAGGVSPGPGSNATCALVWVSQGRGGAPALRHLRRAEGAWPLPATIAEGAHLTDAEVSCPAPGACAASWTHRANGSDVRSIAAWDGSGWSQPWEDANTSLWGPFDCASGRECVLTGAVYEPVPVTRTDVASFRYATWDGTALSAPRDPGVAFDVRPLSLSCPSEGSCLLVFEFYDAWRMGSGMGAMAWDGSRWSPPVVLENATYLGPASLSCAAPSFCMLVWASAPSGYANMAELRYRTWDGSGWSADGVLFGQHDQDLSSKPSLSCPSSDLCVAAWTAREGSGVLSATWDGRRWSAARPVARMAGPEAYDPSVSCTPDGYCALAWCAPVGPDEFGIEVFVVEQEGRGWSDPIRLTSDQRADWRASVSCAQ